MNPTHTPQVIAGILGWDLDAMNDLEKVTLVRRRVVYEEVVISKDEFEKMNDKVLNYDDEFYLNEIEMTDIGFPDFVEPETEYIAFPGDVTSFTDDAIGCLFTNKTWTDGFEPVNLSS